jgi:2-keto-4-pentenoate hydratase/2-oxohepta-3-ene-1,7-dioic acid hydratase in catechol pathway
VNQQILIKASHVLKPNNNSTFRTKDYNGVLTLAQNSEIKTPPQEFVELIFGYMNANDISRRQLISVFQTLYIFP